jgi:hypothetical protein
MNRFFWSMTLAASVSAAAAAVYAQDGPPTKPGRYVIIGCVERNSGNGPKYKLTGAPDGTIRLEGDQAELEYQVGHKVEVAGSFDKASLNSPGPILKVQTITYISPTCK